MLKIKIPFTKKEIEIRGSTLSDPPDWFREFVNGGMTSNTGVTVTEENALTITAYLAAVRILSESVASLPLNLYKEDGKSKKLDKKHPLYRVLHDQANDEMTAYQFREALQGHICGWGNGYAEIERNGRGQVVALWPLLPDRTYPERDVRTGKIYYRTTIGPTYEKQILLPFDKVLHIPGFGYDGIVGYNPVRLAREALGLALASEEYGGRFFGDGANVSGIVEYPGKLSDVAYERYKREINEGLSGLKKAHRLWILEEGLKYHRVGIPPEEAQFLQTRKFQISEIARMFRVPLHMLAELDRSTNNNIEHQSQEFVTYTLRPWLVRWEQQIRFKLLSDSDKNAGYYAKHAVDALLRGVTKDRYESYQVALQNGWLNRDEVRELEDQNPMPDGLGEVFTVNAATLPLTKGGEALGQPAGNTSGTAGGDPAGGTQGG